MPGAACTSAPTSTAATGGSPTPCARPGWRSPGLVAKDRPPRGEGLVLHAVTIAEIAAALDARAVGAADLPVTGAAEPRDAGPDDIALAMGARYVEALSEGRARTALLADGTDWQALGLDAAILVGRPRLAMAGLTRILDPGPGIAPGHHPAAIVDPTAQIGVGAAIGPFAVIGAGARIGANARIGAHASIGAETTIGVDALIHPGARIGARVRIGDRVILQPGATIGADGFSFVTEQVSGVERTRETLGDRGTVIDQPWLRIHSLGGVEIGNDVEVGANACIDRGTIRATRIGSGTKIDNLVQVGHNCDVGRDVLICALAGLSGSVTVGDRTVLAGQVGVADNTRVGSDVVAGGAAKIFTNVPDGRVVLGYPAMKMDAFLAASRNWRRLPRLFARVEALQKAVQKTREDR